jgi:hypothetical protein
MYVSISDKIQQEIILKVCDVFAFYNIVLADMLDLNDSKPIRTSTVVFEKMSVSIRELLSLCPVLEGCLPYTVVCF